MIHLRYLLLLIICLMGSPTLLQAQEDESAPWISYPTANVNNYGVYHFRRSFTLDQAPSRLVVHVSGDNRYQLFVNGQRVAYGPAKGDLTTYKYDEVDIAPFLATGDNVIAALVFNGGQDKPLALITYQTAFMVRAADTTYRFLDTDRRWKTYQNPAYDQITYAELKVWEWVKGFYACGGGDEVFADRYPWGWERLDYDDQTWLSAEVLTFGGGTPWHLVPRSIPFMEGPVERPARIRRVSGLDAPESSYSVDSPISVPPHTSATILYDFGVFTMGYPELLLNGGTGSKVKLRYAEALYDKPDLKAHRDSVEGKTMYGVFDIYHADGGRNRQFRPLWKRAFRYLSLEVSTDDDSLEIMSLVNEHSGFLYPEMSTFEADDPELNAIFNMCLRTLRMCSAETYYDTPYYEQLSYGGDNRPIGALSIYNSTDDRLFREVMRLYPQSVNSGTKLFKSAYPSRFDFDMGTWSLAWVQTLNDYYRLRGDSAWVKPFVGAIEGVLTYFERNVDESVDMLGPLDVRNFIDWSIHYGRVPQRTPKDTITHSAMMTLYFAHTLDGAVQLYQEIGEDQKAEKWKALSERLKSSVYGRCWDERKQRFADYPAKQSFSHHTNVLAILTDALPDDEQRALMEQVLTADDFDEVASSYFQFFVFKAMEKTGYDDQFLHHLGFWEMFLDRGSTTSGETGFASHDRSDCHAWSAHPAYYLLRFVAGIKPASVGFDEVLVSPQLDSLQQVRATLPHPEGTISVDYRREGDQLTATVNLPAGLQGRWSYQGTERPLTSGENTIVQPVR